MFEQSINYPAVLAAVIINMALGSVWYGPLFGKQWMKLTGRTKESMEKDKSDMPKVMGGMALLALVQTLVLAAFVGYSGAATVLTGAVVGFWAWLGFVFVTAMQDVLFQKKNSNLAGINIAYNLVTLLINGAVLAVWR